MSRPMAMVWLLWADTPDGRTRIEQQLDEFLQSLGLNPGPGGY